MLDKTAVSPPVVKSARRADRVLAAIVLVVALASAVYLARQAVVFRAYPFDNDEAAHALPALLMAQDLAEGDARGFISEVYRQNFYPPGTAIFLIPAYLIAGPSPLTARLVSVASLFLAILVMFAIAREIDPARGAAAGLIAILLTLSARPLLTTAGLVMLEAPGLFVCLVLLWATIVSLRQPRATVLILVSLLMAAAFLTKYTYGLVSLAAIGTNELVELRTANGRAQLRRRWPLLFGPFLVVMALWFIRPGQLSAFFDYTQPLAKDQGWLSLSNLLYYPRSFAIHSTPSILFALVNLGALVWAFFNRREAGIRILLFYFLYGMAAIMLVNHPANPRFISTFVPAAQLITGLMIVRLWPFGGRGNNESHGDRPVERNPRIASRALSIAAVLGLAVVSLPTVIQRYVHYPSLIEAQLETTPAMNDLATWVGSHVPANGSIYLINIWDNYSPLQLQWEIATRTGGPPPAVIAKVLDPATPDRTAALTREILNGDAAALVLVEGGPWGSPFWPDYTEALQDNLREVTRRSFRLESYQVSEWLDDNSLKSADWSAIKEGSRQSMEVGIIIYEITRP